MGFTQTLAQSANLPEAFVYYAFAGISVVSAVCVFILFANTAFYFAFITTLFAQTQTILTDSPFPITICDGSVCLDGYVLERAGDCFVCTPYIPTNATGPWCDAQPNDLGVWYASRYNDTGECYDLEDTEFDDAAARVTAVEAEETAGTADVGSALSDMAAANGSALAGCARAATTEASLVTTDGDMTALEGAVANTTAWVAYLEGLPRTTLNESGGEVLISNAGPDIQLRSLVGDEGVSLTYNGTSIIVVEMASVTPDDATLGSTGGGLSLVANATGPALGTWNVDAADASVTVTSNANDVLIEAATTTLTSIGAGTPVMINDDEIRGLLGGNQITVTPNGNEVQVETGFRGDAFTLSGGFAVDGIGPSLSIRGLTAGTDVSLSQTATDVIINATGGVDTVSNLTSAGGDMSLVLDGTGHDLRLRPISSSIGPAPVDNSTEITLVGNLTRGCYEVFSNPTVSSTAPGGILVNTFLGWYRICGNSNGVGRKTVTVYFGANWFSTSDGSFDFSIPGVPLTLSIFNYNGVCVTPLSATPNTRTFVSIFGSVFGRAFVVSDGAASPVKISCTLSYMIE